MISACHDEDAENGCMVQIGHYTLASTCGVVE